MLAKKNRLKKREDFDNVYKKGRRIGSRFFLIKTIKGNKDTRIGFIVSKKVVSKIVLRNKLKRRMREAVQSFQGDIKKGYDIIIIALFGSSEKKYSELKKDLINLFQQGKLLINEKNSSKAN